MRSLHKKPQTNIRWTAAQLRDVERAVQIESRRRGEIVERAALIRELALAGVARILIDSGQSPSSTGAAASPAA